MTITTSQSCMAALLLSASAATLAGPATPHDRARLNDTGSTLCVHTATGSVLASCTGTGQDGEFGRDVTHNDPDDGIAGFRFRRVCNSGEYAGNGGCPAEPVLGPGANDWACTADRVTGFIWEVKTTDGGLRDMNKIYTNQGYAMGDDVDLSEHVSAVNAAGLCGASDWHTPSDQQLLSIVNFNTRAPGPTIGWIYFPNTAPSLYWTVTVGYRMPSSAQAAGSLLLARPPWVTIRFSNAELAATEPYLYAHSRLVRTAKRSDAPRFVRSADRTTVTDNWTRLEWRYCAEGRTLPVGDGPCTGSALDVDWAGALAAANAAGDGWRLPNIKELDSLMDRPRPIPPTLAYAFGDWGPYTLPSYNWWSGTPLRDGGGAAWAIDVGGGVMRTGVGQTGVVRLVRSAP